MSFVYVYSDKAILWCGAMSLWFADVYVKKLLGALWDAVCISLH